MNATPEQSEINQKDIRWKQRFENLSLAASNLKAAINLPTPDIFQRAGMIQFFEMSFELAWKTLQDYLQYQGVLEIKTPRAVIKKAFEVGLIRDGETWLRALEDRNLTSHTYNEETAGEVEELIREIYFPLIQQLLDCLGAAHEKD
jgi:nucleotidyltransferase substrate binding protein (TIGR01987 family)